MGIISELFKKKDEPAPYDWQFLKEQCLLAMAELGESALGGLDFDRLEVSDENAEDVVMEIHAVLTDGKTPGLSVTQAQEYLLRADELLRTDVTASAAGAGLREIEECMRKKHPELPI